MTKFTALAFSAAFATSMFISPASFAQAPAAAPSASGSCADKAIGKNGKALAGAAKTSFMKKCSADSKGASAATSSCADKAISKSGKPLSGAAKASSIKKCEADAKGGK